MPEQSHWPSPPTFGNEIEQEMALIAYFGDEEPKAGSRGTPLQRKHLRDALLRWESDDD